MVMYFYVIHKDLKEDLSSYLEKGELLIDYTMDEPYAYTLVSKQGPDGYGDFFAVFEKKNKGWQRIYEKDFKNFMPWKIEIADIDGDDLKEILIAVRTTTLFDKDLKNRLFVFNFNDGALVKKWTGSQISGTWRDFYTGDVFSIPGHELIFIECTENDREKISIYTWFDFGFLKVAESEAYDKIKELKTAGSNCLEITYQIEGQNYKHILKAADGKLEDVKPVE